MNPADYIHRVGRVGRVGGDPDGHVTSLVDNMGGVMVLQNIETAVRKNKEIQKVNNNIIRIIHSDPREEVGRLLLDGSSFVIRARRASGGTFQTKLSIF